MTDSFGWYHHKHWQHSHSFARKIWIESAKEFGVPNGMHKMKWHRMNYPYRGKQFYVQLNSYRCRYKSKHGWCKDRAWFKSYYGVVPERASTS